MGGDGISCFDGVCRCVFGVGVEDGELAGWTAVDDLKGDTGTNGVVESGDIEIRLIGADCASFESAEETVGAVDGEIVGSLGGLELPAIGDQGSGFQGVGPRPILGVTGSDVEDGGSFADVVEVDAEGLLEEVGLPLDVEDVGDGAGWSRSRLLYGDGLKSCFWFILG